MMQAGTHGGIVESIVRQFVVRPLSVLIIFATVVAGIIAITATPREEEPQIVVPMADVEVRFPGASAKEVERLVAAPLEKLLWQVDGVEHVYSVSRRDMAVVTVRFFVGEPREEALVRLQSKISAHTDAVPSGVSGWVVKPVDIDDVPIVSLTLWGETAKPATLRRVAEELAVRLEEVPDLSRSEIIGGYPREVRVEIDPDALQARRLSMLEVVKSVQGADASLIVGSFSKRNNQISVLSGPFIGESSDLEKLVVGVYEQRPVYLTDVARIIDGPVEPKNYTRISFGAASLQHRNLRGESYPAVTIALSKKRGTNAVKVAEHVLEFAEELKQELVPEGINLEVTRNYGETANEKVNELLRELVLAILTVIALIGMSLGWRAAVIVAAAVPITFALTLFVNLITGYTINRVTLFALVLSLGLVVDDPIVDVENIHRHFARKKEPPLKALLSAVNEVRIPVIIATLAVIVSFLPMLFITGMMGPYMKPMAINVPVAMLMSLLVAFTITPWMCFHIMKSEYGKHEAEDESEGKIPRLYRGWMGKILDDPKYRKRTFLIVGFLFCFGVFLAVIRAVPLKMLPYDNKSELQVTIDLPEGVSVEKTDQVVSEVEQFLSRVPETTNFESYVGTSSPIDFNGLVRHYGMRQSANLGDIRVNLAPKDERSQQSHEITLRLIPGLNKIGDKFQAKIKVVELPPGPPVLSTVVAEVYGAASASYQDLISEAQKVKELLSEVPGVVDIDDMAEAKHSRLNFVLNKEKAALHGVSTEDIVRTLRAALSGVAAARVHSPDERFPRYIRVVLPKELRSSREFISRLGIKGNQGNLVPVAELGNLEQQLEDQPVYHKDLRPVVFVTSEVAGVSPPEVVLSMNNKLSKKPLLKGTDVNWSGEGEWKITVDVFRDLGIAFGLALVAVYILIVVQTNSLLLPLIIMLSIPLGVIGIFPGFWLLNVLFGNSVGGFENPIWFTATGMIGMIALSGIVVRNSIILVDFIQARVKAGMQLREAIIESGTKRMRPIILTAVAAMLGAWPITLDPIFSGLAWSLIFGLIASTFFTLIIIPAAFWQIYGDSGKDNCRKKLTKKTDSQ